MRSIFAVIWGQCSEALKDKLKSSTDYRTSQTTGDCVWLLKTIKAIMLKFDGQRDLSLSLSDAHLRLYLFRQGNDMTLTAHKTEFENRLDVIEHYGGAVGQDPALLSLVSASMADVAERAKSSRNRYLRMLFLSKSDRRRYGTLWADLENQFVRGNNQYLKDPTGHTAC
jgi:hypothetical protein